MKSDLFVWSGLKMASGLSQKSNNFDLFFLSKIKGLSNRSVWQYIAKGENSQKIKQLIEETKNDRDFLARTKAEFDKIDENYISILDNAYPENLKNIYDPPLFLFYRGDIDLLKSQYLLTVVGSRTITSYHTGMTINIISQFQHQPMIIISGLAFGIDSLAHQTAINNKLKTIAVLGSGLDNQVIYPRQNIALAEKIIKTGGLLLSEYPKDTNPAIHHFPKRNRILAGLSKATIVISGASKSGTLITAQVALDEGREVYALPGNINQSLNQGPNNLIKNGANLLSSAEEVLSLYNITSDNLEEKIKFANQNQAKIYALLKIEALTLAQLSKKLNLSLPQTNALVS